MVSDQLPEIDAFRPTLVTFQAGANDIAGGVTAEEYREGVETDVDAATARGARVVVLAQNEWFRSPEGENYGTGLADRRAAVDDVLIEEASARARIRRPTGALRAAGRRRAQGPVRDPSHARGLRRVGR